jgi:Fur family ferric uptake transcriptional regulator
MERDTAQRRAVRKAVESAGRPLDAGEVQKAGRRWCKTLGQATVYRALSDGVEAGWLRPVSMPEGPTRYELADLPHHHHFECVKCHRVFDVEGCPGGLKGLVPEGFTLESHEVLLYGRCSKCAA